MQAYRGFTLVEMLAVLAISAILLAGASAWWQDMIPRQHLIARANALVGLVYLARERASEGYPVLVCATDGVSACTAFRDAQRLAIIEDRNANDRFDENDVLVREMSLPPGMTSSWRSFRNKPWLKFNYRARSYYQNGHFLLCYRDQGIKVIVTRIGRPRVQKGGTKKMPCR